MAIVESKTAVERIYTIPVPLGGATAVPASATNEYPLFRSDRQIQFRNVGFYVGQTSVSGAPATNTMRLELWNFTDSTLLAKATIHGTTGTKISRLVYQSLATKSQFIGPGSEASAAKVFTLKAVGANTLSHGLIKPVVEILADVIDP